MNKLYKNAFVLLILMSLNIKCYALGNAKLAISPQILVSTSVPFISHSGPGAFDNALAMNIPYQPVAMVRHQLSALLNYNLSAFKGWNAQGEAHITAITPPEYSILGRYVSIYKMNEIAAKNSIQNSDFQILGMGSGFLNVNSNIQSTCFLIVNSLNLLSIRKQIYNEYLRNGGPEGSWNPLHFYPHITAGFTLRDLHEQDGVIRNKGSASFT